MEKKKMVEDSPKEFILEFFKDSKINDEKGVLTISEVPKEFEDFIGKRAPYRLVFDFDLHTRIKDSELIMKGSYFTLAMRDYLSNKGQTSLLKIDITPDFQEINKNSKLKNCKMLEIQPEDQGFLYEFSFLSTYQYLNDKKQSINKFLVGKNDIVDADITKFKIIKSNKEEIPSLDALESYKTAKKELDKKVHTEIKPIKLLLKEKLEKELFRVKDHYFKQIREKDEEVESCANKIKMLQSKLRHTSYDRDIRILERTIQESKERLENLKKKTYRERLKIEEVFHINDEVEKHALSIKNVLINVAVFYYPIFSIAFLNKAKKEIKRYDPVLKKFI
jgi:hypothetical protein